MQVVPMARLTATTMGIAGTTGRVMVTPAGTSCGTGCWAFTQGQSVTVVATGDAPALFAAWSGDCVGQGATCTLVLSADKTIAAHFRPNMNIMFVTEGTLVPARIGSDLATADRFCVDSAGAAFLGGSRWKAWLATSAATTNINAATHVGGSTTGWIRVDGRPFATSTANLLAGKILYPPKITEANNDRSLFFAVVTGALGDGSVIPNGTCGDWTSSGNAFSGNVTTTTGSWTDQFFTNGDSCATSQYPIYCFENDSGMAVVPTPVAPANARHAFLSRTLWVPGAGTSAADAACQSEATAAGLGSTANYRALLTTAVAATDPTRINLAGQPWFRLDGAQLVATALDLAAPAADKLLTPLNLDSSGSYVANFVAWTGNGIAPAGTSMVLNCANWTSTTASSWMGLANVAGSGWWANNTQPCNGAARLYCFER